MTDCAACREARSPRRSGGRSRNRFSCPQERPCRRPNHRTGRAAWALPLQPLLQPALPRVWAWAAWWSAPERPALRRAPKLRAVVVPLLEPQRPPRRAAKPSTAMVGDYALDPRRAGAPYKPFNFNPIRPVGEQIRHLRAVKRKHLSSRLNISPCSALRDDQHIRIPAGGPYYFSTGARGDVLAPGQRAPTRHYSEAVPWARYR